ncbi:MAG TPA: D-2-hydroxyacid dehydrogenase [Terriglobales bacterium]|nr:D-2-hydroxyacid dehydrogenase [Terriglobales bacterium]
MTTPLEKPTRKLLVLTYHHFDLWIAPPWFSTKLQEEFPELSVSQLNSLDNVEQLITDVEIMFAVSLLPEQFLAAKKLRWIHSQSAAVHQFMFPELIDSDVILTNARDVHGPVVAEHVMAVIFALAKQIPAAVRFQQQHEWGQEAMSRGRNRSRDVSGATLGLVGLGSIGRHVAQHAASLGMRVIATREHTEKEKPPGVDEVLPSSRLRDLLTRSDYVVLSAPITPETTGMIGREQLAIMKPDACLINVGRGPLLDETALIEALRERRIGGAALDVFEKEPLPSDSPFWALENVLITPHTAGISDKMWERHYALFSENLRRYLSGRPLLGLVNKQRGY